MVITALDTSFNAVAIVEAYKSFIWTDRYTDVGDFELYVPASAPYLDKIHNDFYLACSETVKGEIQRLMIVEKIEYKTDLEDGNSVLITGRSLESILDRRIIWKDDGSVTEVNRETIHEKIPSIVYDDYDTKKSFPLQNGIQYLLEMNLINPTNLNRKISFLTFVESTDSRITSLTMTPCAYRGDNLYDIIRGLCDMFGISFKIEFDTTNPLIPKFVFKLYKGINHLSSQSENGYICFSTEFDNLLSSDNSMDMSTYKTMAYYVGKGEKWSVKEYIKTEMCLTGWIRVFKNALYACYRDMQETDIPRPDNKNPANDTDFWKPVTDWTHSTLYNTGDYVAYGIEVYRIDHDVIEYNSSVAYAAGAVVMSDSWMYVSLIDDNQDPLTNDNSWYKCANESQCFNAQDWEQVQSVLKDSYDISGDVQNNSTAGMDRRELFVDATNVPSSYTYYPDGATEMHYILDKGVYEATLKDKALSELTAPNNRPTKNFDCEIETNVSFKYGKDYEIGDVIEVKDTYGFVDSVVVNSYIISHDESGVFSAYPTFEAVESSTIITKYLTVDMALSTGTFLLKVPESTRFVDTQVIATAKNTATNTTYYLMSFVKRIKSDSTFSTGQTDRELHIVAWTTDQNVYTDGRYQPEDQVLKVGPAIVGTPMFYINIEGGITLPGVLNPSWLPPIDVDLGDILSVDENKAQYKNILIANL